MTSPIRAVVFDVGETLIDETRVWGRWADWMGVSRLTFFTVLGATIARGQSQRHAFEVVDPSFQPWAEIQRRRERGEDDGEPDERDLYPDVLPALAELKAAGLVVGAAGNQFAGSETWLSRVRPAFDLIGSSERWGVHKPSAEFFERLARELALAPEEIAYVGDRLDNDVIPAAAAGMFAVVVKRGPWGHILTDSDTPLPGPMIGRLQGELAEVLEAENRRRAATSDEAPAG